MYEHSQQIWDSLFSEIIFIHFHLIKRTPKGSPRWAKHYRPRVRRDPGWPCKHWKKLWYHREQKEVVQVL